MAIEIIKRALKAVTYNPQRHARKLAFISIEAGALILPSARFIFRLGSRSFKGHIRISSGAIVANEFIFESNQGEVNIGRGTFINSGTKLICRERISIGEDVTIAWGCTIYDHNSHSLAWQDRVSDIRQQMIDIQAGRNFISSKNWSNVKSRPIEIHNRAWLGFGVTVLNGVIIGEGAVIGACSVVRDSIEPWSLALGNPAVIIKTVRE